MEIQRLEDQNKLLSKKIISDKIKVQKLKSQWITLSLAIKQNSAKQRETVKKIFIAQGKITILPEKTEKKPYIKKIKTDIEKNISKLKSKDQDEMLRRLLAIREERRKNEKNNKNKN